MIIFDRGAAGLLYNGFRLRYTVELYEEEKLSRRKPFLTWCNFTQKNSVVKELSVNILFMQTLIGVEVVVVNSPYAQFMQCQ